MRAPTRLLSLAAAAFILFLAVRPARADMVGFRGGVYTNISEPFLGFELLFPLDHRVYVNPNLEYVFVPNDTYLTGNLDAHYDFRTHSRAYVWAGGGLAIIYENPEGPRRSRTDAGANLLFGIGLKGDVVPYVQAKLIAKRGTEVVLAFGIRF